jgi:hypothetical protein
MKFSFVFHLAGLAFCIYACGGRSAAGEGQAPAVPAALDSSATEAAPVAALAPAAAEAASAAVAPAASGEAKTAVPPETPPPVKPIAAVASAAPPAPTAPAAAPPKHEQWDALLQQYVSADGRVDYAGLLGEKSRLQSYLDALAALPPEKSWGRNEQLAYWINAYNAFTVKLILDHYPLASILSLHGSKPWDVSWIEIGGKKYSLNQIEHEIIRKQFREPRIHFAVNCAAVSCPPLLNRAWTADKLETYFSRQAKNFINNPKYNQLGAGALRLSKIFEWYAEDFGDIIKYLNTYASSPISPAAEVSYLEYDWRLNGK